MLEEGEMDPNGNFFYAFERRGEGYLSDGKSNVVSRVGGSPRDEEEM